MEVNNPCHNDGVYLYPYLYLRDYVILKLDMGTTTQQEEPKRGNNPNGVGGFGDNPQNRNPGGWDKNESISYWYNKIGRMSDKEMAEFKPANQNQRIALVRIERSKRDDKEALAEAKEITDRTEGKAKETLSVDASIDMNVGTPSVELANQFANFLKGKE